MAKFDAAVEHYSFPRNGLREEDATATLRETKRLIHAARRSLGAPRPHVIDGDGTAQVA